MIIRVYAADAVRIAEEYGIEDDVVGTKVTWDATPVYYPLFGSANLVKMRVGGGKERFVHNYFLVCAEQDEAQTFEVVESLCSHERCYYRMPEVLSAGSIAG